MCHPKPEAFLASTAYRVDGTLRNASGSVGGTIWNASCLGFTLLEMMLAIAFFAAGTVAAAELFHRAQAGSKEGESAFIATTLAHQCLETLKNVAFASLTVGNGVMGSINGCSASPSGLPAPTDGTLIRSVTISQPFLPDTNLKQISVTVSWSAPGGTTNVVLQTRRSNV